MSDDKDLNQKNEKEIKLSDQLKKFYQTQNNIHDNLIPNLLGGIAIGLNPQNNLKAIDPPKLLGDTAIDLSKTNLNNNIVLPNLLNQVTLGLKNPLNKNYIDTKKILAASTNPLNYLNSTKTIEATKTIASSIINKNIIENDIKTAEAAKTLVNIIKPTFTNLKSPDVAKKITEEIGIGLPSISQQNIKSFTDTLLNNLELVKPPKIPSNVYLSNLLVKTKISIDEENIPQTINNISKNIIDDWINKLPSNKKIELSYCIKYDIYPPLFLLNKIPFSQDFSSQEEADEYMNNLLSTLEENKKTVIDCIPETKENYNDKIKIKQLYKMGYSKILILYIFERIENLINKIRFKYSDKTIRDRTSQQQTASEFLQIIKDNTNDPEHKNIINEIFKNKLLNENNKLKLSLFEAFSSNEDIIKKIGTQKIPLNRNIFMHGYVEDENVTELLVNKAILAFGFFTSLSATIKE